MSSVDIGVRLKKLRDLREKLCSNEKNWDEAFKARDWIVDQLQTLQNLTLEETSTKEDINNKLVDIISVLAPKKGDKK